MSELVESDMDTIKKNTAMIWSLKLMEGEEDLLRHKKLKPAALRQIRRQPAS